MAKKATSPQTASSDEESGSYEDILDRQWDNIPKAQILPEGSWLLKSRNASFIAPKGENSPVCLFVFAPKEPFDDVSAEELEALGTDYDVTTNRIFYRKYVETAADWDDVRELLTKMGVDLKGKTIRASLKEVKGSEIVGYLKQRSYQNDAGQTKVENTVSNFAVVE